MDIHITPSAHASVSHFNHDPSLFAQAFSLLPLSANSSTGTSNAAHSLDPCFPTIPFPSTASLTSSKPAFQHALNRLEPLLTLTNPMYLILRRPANLSPNQHVGEQHLIFVTYVPYRADSQTKQALLSHRNDVIKELGLAKCADVGEVVSLVCKEIGEVVDSRSWEERDGAGKSSEGQVGDLHGIRGHNGEGARDDKLNDDGACVDGIKDLGFKQNKCRLCDRRMKNPMDSDALDALSYNLTRKGDCVQLHVDISTDTLKLTCPPKAISPPDLSSLLPRSTPGFTFYRHPLTGELHFIYFSPDSASVQLRMRHTLALPGLLVIARDAGVHVNRKHEIHDVHELNLDDNQQERSRDGKYRSMYLRNEIVGTESKWEGMESV